MNAPTPGAVLEIPYFLERKEPQALYALWNNGRFHIVKGEISVSLSQDDLQGLRRYFDQFSGEK